MTENKYTKALKELKEKVDLNAALSDAEMANASGGVGGADEATCPECGQPMRLVDNAYGDNYWHCDACNIDQYLSDKDTIEILKAAEAAGQMQGIVIPVWYDPKKF